MSFGRRYHLLKETSQRQNQAELWDLRFSATFGTVDWLLFTDVSGQPTPPIFKGISAQKTGLFTLEDGPTGCPETSVTNYQCTLCTNPGEKIFHPHRGEGLKSLTVVDIRTWRQHLPAKNHYIHVTTELIRENVTDNRRSRLPWNIGPCLPEYTVSHPRRQSS
jgi:hypothetical protein